MSDRRWAHLLLQARTARDQHWPITVLLGYRAQDGTVNDRDRIMAMALRSYEDSLCPGCGLPAHKTRGDKNVGRWEAKADEVCHGCAPLEDMREALNAGRENKFPGQKLYPVET